MAYATNTYPGDGVTTNFTLTFPYLSQAHVSVEVDGVPVAFTWLNASTVVVSPAPAGGTTVKVYRNTSRTVPLVDYTNGELLEEVALDLAYRHTLYVAQEAFDASEAVENTTQLQAWANAAAASALAAAASAAAASVSETSAGASAVAALASETAAAISESNAAASELAAAASEAAAAGYASSALLKANNLSDLVDASAARTALGLGTAATQASTAFATAAQGTKADSALQPNALVTTEAATILGDGNVGTDTIAGKILELKSGAANTNGARWFFSHNKNGVSDFLTLSAINDAGSAGTPIFQIQRTGSTFDSMLWYGDHTFITVMAGNLTMGSGGYIDGSDPDAAITFGPGGSVAAITDFNVITARKFGTPALEDLGNKTGSITIDLGAIADRAKLALTGNVSVTFTAPSFPCTKRLYVLQDSTPRTWTDVTTVGYDKDLSAAQKTVGTTASKWNLLVLDYDGTRYVGNWIREYA